MAPLKDPNGFSAFRSPEMFSPPLPCCPKLNSEQRGLHIGLPCSQLLAAVASALLFTQQHSSAFHSRCLGAGHLRAAGVCRLRCQTPDLAGFPGWQAVLAALAGASSQRAQSVSFGTRRCLPLWHTRDHPSVFLGPHAGRWVLSGPVKLLGADLPGRRRMLQIAMKSAQGYHRVFCFRACCCSTLLHLVMRSVTTALRLASFRRRHDQRPQEALNGYGC